MKMKNNIFLRVLNRIGYLKNRLFVKTKLFYGKSWLVPIQNELGYSFFIDNNTEKWIFDLLQFINSKFVVDSFFDVGVNIGQTLIKVKTINPQIKYVGFEPNFNCLQYTQYLVNLNKCTNVELLNIGLSNSNELVRLNAFGETDTRATLSSNNIDKKDIAYSIWIPTMRLDDIFFNFEKSNCSIIKIDVEGLELQVLEGAKEFIQTLNPIVIIEVLPHLNNKDKQNNGSKLYDFLLDRTYTVFLINVNKNNLHKVDSFNENIDDYSKTDYLAIPNFMIDDFARYF
jgi:FkbM family methyltransferase